MVKETSNSYISGDFGSPISNHPFLRYVMEITPLYIMQHSDMKKVMFGGVDRDNETIDEALRNSTVMDGDDCKFLADESAYTYELMLRIDKIQHAFFMISYFPKSPEKNDLPLTRAEYMEDLLELYVVNSISLYDRILELVAFLYGAKLTRDDKKRKEKLYEDLKDHAGIVVVLKQFDHVLKGIRKSRNTIIHQASYYDEDLENIFQYEIRYRAERARNDKHELDMLRELKRLYKVYEQQVLTDLHTNDAILTKLLIDLLDCLYAQHRQRAKALGIKTKFQVDPKRKRSSRLRENASIVNAIDWWGATDEN